MTILPKIQFQTGLALYLRLIRKNRRLFFDRTIDATNLYQRAMNFKLRRCRVGLSAWFLPSWLVLLALCASVYAQFDQHSETVFVRTTNYVPRYITNVIKVSIPTNSFYDEYRTNWVRQKITNVVDVFRTNFSTEYRTNLIPVAEFRTNVQVAYVTNLKHISLTNWETVLVMKTNWVNLPVTNVVQLDLPTPRPELAAPSQLKSAPAQPEPSRAAEPVRPAAPAAPSTGMEFQLVQTAKPIAPDQHPIRLVLRTAGGGDGVLPVQEWRVERVNGTAFSVGSKAEFTGTLPAGSYRITARLRGADNVLRILRGQVEVTADGAAQTVPATTASPR